MEFGDYIRSKGYTAKSLAEKVGISIRTMEGYTTGRFALRKCRAWLIVALADALETTPKELISMDD